MKLGLDDQSRLGRQQFETVAEGSGRGGFVGLPDGLRGFGPGGVGGQNVVLDRFEFARRRDIAGTAGGWLQLHPAGLTRAEADRRGDPSRGPGDFPAQGTSPEPPDILIDPNSGTLHRTHPQEIRRRDPRRHIAMVTPPATVGRVTPHLAVLRQPRCALCDAVPGASRSPGCPSHPTSRLEGGEKLGQSPKGPESRGADPPGSPERTRGIREIFRNSSHIPIRASFDSMIRRGSDVIPRTALSVRRTVSRPEHVRPGDPAL